MNLLEGIRNDALDFGQPVSLYRSTGREVDWIGSLQDTIFHCNAYLLRSGKQTYLIDPGGREHFPQVRDRVSKLMKPSEVTHIIVHHQDPDLCASIPLWLEINPGITVLTHSRAAVLLPHYGFPSERVTPIDGGQFTLAEGELHFIPAPFLHFPGAFATYDTTTGFLFSGDIFAALSSDWKLAVENLDEHLGLMELFHIDYMANNRAARGFLDNLGDRRVSAILPQHGSIIRQADVGAAFSWLRELPCGLDIIYAD